MIKSLFKSWKLIKELEKQMKELEFHIIKLEKRIEKFEQQVKDLQKENYYTIQENKEQILKTLISNISNQNPSNIP
jgi:parvulin-like peptidyl-prolyl isomerase